MDIRNGLDMCAGLLVAALCGGCNQTAARVAQPEYPSDAGNNAVEHFDRNADGAIGGTELEAAPSLKIALPRLDLNHDGSLSAEEISRAVQAWIDSRVALMPVQASISLNGKPLGGAEITLEPEQFLGESMATAHGTTDPDGFVALGGSNPRARGVPLGWYRVIVSKKDGERETVAERFNSKTELGIEVTPENAISLQRVVWNLR